MWKVLEHARFDKLEDNLWCVEGALPGMALRRRMTLVKLSDGRLVVHSPIALQEAAMAELEAFGEVAFILVPSGFHRMDAPAYKARYPRAQVVCPAASRKRVAKVVAVDGDLSALPDDPALSCGAIADNRAGEVALRVTHGDGGVTLVFNDAVFNQPHQPGFGGWIMRVIGSSGGPRVTNTARLFLVNDKAAFALALRELASTPGLKRLVVSHGEPVERDAADVLRAVADGLHPG